MGRRDDEVAELTAEVGALRNEAAELRARLEQEREWRRDFGAAATAAVASAAPAVAAPTRPSAPSVGGSSAGGE
eukprot:gene29658-51584_t